MSGVKFPVNNNSAVEMNDGVVVFLPRSNPHAVIFSIAGNDSAIDGVKKVPVNSNSLACFGCVEFADYAELSIRR